MRKAPCITADQSQMQEAHTNQPERVCSLSIAGPPEKIKEVIMHTRDEYEENERELLALYRKLSWKNQVRFIGRLSSFVEQEYRTAPAVEPVKSSGKVILFPAVARV